MTIKTCSKCGVCFDGDIENITLKTLYKKMDGHGCHFFYLECPLCHHKKKSKGGFYDFEFDEEMKEQNIESE